MPHSQRLLTALALLALASCHAQHTMRPLDLSTPEKTLTAFLDAVAADDPVALRQTIHASTPNAQKFADDFCLFTVTMNRYVAAARQRFPRELADHTLAAASALTQTRQALRHARITITGNRATLALGPPPENVPFYGLFTTLIRTDHRWQLDADPTPNLDRYPFADEVQYIVHNGAACAPAYESIIADLRAGRFQTYAEHVAALSQRIDPTIQRLQAEEAEYQRQHSPTSAPTPTSQPTP